MRKPTYSVVASVITVLSVFALFLKLVTPYLPPPKGNGLELQNADYLSQASRQKIQWHTLNPGAFLLAQRDNKPIMLLLGASWNKDGRTADNTVFLDPDVQNILSANFVCVRVDCSEMPEWLNAYFPISRLSLGLPTGFQIYFLTPEGRLIDYLSADWLNNPRDSSLFTQGLVSAREMYSGIRGNAAPTKQASLQSEDLTSLTMNGSSAPDFRAYDAILEKALDANNGGFPVAGEQSMLPSVYRYLLLTGKTQLLRAALDPLLRSSVVDWMDGGFFHGSETADWSSVDFDKVAVENAEMMFACALDAAINGSGNSKRVAARTFDSLTGEFMWDGFVSNCRIGDENLLGRSEHSSFAASDFRSLWRSSVLPPEESRWAQDALGLDVSKNPQMTIRIKDPEKAFSDPSRFSEVLRRLTNSKRAKKPTFSTQAYASVNGFVTARLVESARLWNDGTRLKKLIPLIDGLEGFREGPDVHHKVGLGTFKTAKLADYLGYADAMLQDYLATGRVVSLDRGTQVLQRAKVLFEWKGTGVFMPVTEDSFQGARDSMAPELMDNLHESWTAQAIRLYTAYGRLQSNVESPDLPNRFLWTASAAINNSSLAALRVGPLGAGYFSAAAQSLDPAYAITVGPDAVSLASALYRRVPSRFVAPAFGNVHPELQKRKPGIYTVRANTVRGPLATDEAAAELGKWLKA